MSISDEHADAKPRHDEASSLNDAKQPPDDATGHAVRTVWPDAAGHGRRARGPRGNGRGRVSARCARGGHGRG
ncbi:unnamed protein product [Heterosigma akashiwo]